MRSLVAIIGILSLVTCGCRIVHNETYTTITGKENQVESLSEGTQAADKEVGDISPSTSATVTPQ